MKNVLWVSANGSERELETKKDIAINFSKMLPVKEYSIFVNNINGMRSFFLKFKTDIALDFYIEAIRADGSCFLSGYVPFPAGTSEKKFNISNYEKFSLVLSSDYNQDIKAVINIAEFKLE